MLKTQAKYLLHGLGLFAPLDSFRRRGETRRWIANGCSGLAPPPVKRKILKSYLRRYGLKNFVETGTHLGDTLAQMAYDADVQCISIELSDEYYAAAAVRFRGQRNVQLVHGDSAKAMATIVRDLSAPALFWLDGHYSGGMTAKGDLETPISAELDCILKSPNKQHVILIDDARCFDGTHDYPELHRILDYIRSQSNYSIEISADIIRLTPFDSDP